MAQTNFYNSVWCVRVYKEEPPVAGESVKITTKAGKEKQETVTAVIRTYDDNSYLCAIETTGKERQAGD